MTDTPRTIHTLAREMADAFETRTRPSSGDDLDTLRDGSPEWMRDVCRAAHGDMFPDDWRYRMIRAAVEWLADEDNDPDESAEFADDFVPIYNGERIDWLASHVDRIGYVDEAREEFGASDLGVMGDIGWGIYMEASEVYGLVVGALASLVDAGEES